MSENNADSTHHGAATAPLFSPGRRAFVKRVAAVAGAASMPGAVFSQTEPDRSALEIPPWTRQQGSPILTPAYGKPSPFEDHVVRRPTDLTPTRISSWSFTPLQDLHGSVTPNGLVFERHHGGVPEINPEQHRLVLHGLVERSLKFTVSELMRFPQVSVTRFLECSGNTLTEWAKPSGTTVQDTHGLLSCCEWTGVPLSIVLKEAGVRPEGQWLLAEGADAAAMTRSIPMDKAMDDALLCYAQNGEALRPEQGYPLRLLLPGYEGNMQIKWLRRLDVGAEPYMTREETSKYTDLMPDGSARQFTFVMEAKSVITQPSGGQHLTATGFQEIRGIAWSGRGRIRRVDVSVDGGRNWETAELEEPVLPKSLTRFRLPWRWRGEVAVLQSRAIDETGMSSPRSSNWWRPGDSIPCITTTPSRAGASPLAGRSPMFTPERRIFRVAAALGITLVAGSAIAASGEGGHYGLGEPISKTELEAWDIDVPPSGEGLPDGSGSVTEGKGVYEAQCASCHGANGKSGAMDRLVGGKGSLDSDKPVKTVGSYWPYATTLYDYIHRAMPFTKPQSLSADEVYAVTAYVLHLNGILDQDATLDKNSLPEVQMPNRDGFQSPDPRPDVSNQACMSDCPVE